MSKINIIIAYHNQLVDKHNQLLNLPFLCKALFGLFIFVEVILLRHKIKTLKSAISLAKQISNY